MSVCFSSPRLGTLPRELENDSVSVVRLSSRTFSLGGVGGGGLTGLGNVVWPLLGRKIKLKPDPAKVPVKFDRTPSGACVLCGIGLISGRRGLVGSRLPSTDWIVKPDGRVIDAGAVA